MALISDCRNHLQNMALDSTAKNHKDSCDDCRKAFQKLTLQSVTRDHNMVGVEGYQNVNPFAEHDNDLKGKPQPTASVAESESEYGEDDDWSPNHDDQIMESELLFLELRSEVCREFYEIGEANRLQSEEESEDEKSINLFEMEEEPSPIESVWFMPLPYKI